MGTAPRRVFDLRPSRKQVKLVRKPRAVGILYLPDEVHRTTSLMLDEIAMGARAAVKRTRKQHRSRETRLPFCTFNGGKDVFVDIGSKDLGIAALQQLVRTQMAAASSSHPFS